MRKPVNFEKLQKVRDVAAAMDPPVPYETLLGRLKEIHASNPGTWLARTGKGNGARYYVSMEDLRAAHPRMFERKIASRDEVEMLIDEVKKLRDDAAKAKEFRAQALAWMKQIAAKTGVALQ